MLAVKLQWCMPVIAEPSQHTGRTRSIAHNDRHVTNMTNECSAATPSGCCWLVLACSNSTFDVGGRLTADRAGGGADKRHHRSDALAWLLSGQSCITDRVSVIINTGSDRC